MAFEYTGIGVRVLPESVFACRPDLLFVSTGIRSPFRVRAFVVFFCRSNDWGHVFYFSSSGAEDEKSFLVECDYERLELPLVTRLMHQPTKKLTQSNVLIH